MKTFVRAIAFWSCIAPLWCTAGEATNCFAAEVEDHVVQQFLTFGPQSKDREFFGFVYRFDGVIASAVTRGAECRWTHACEVKTKKAAAKVPKGAKVLAEWHTHPHVTGVLQLSPDDVRGASNNRHIRCYRAFFSTADGDILMWDVNALAVRAAMASTVSLGNYRRPREAGTPYAGASR